MKFTTTILDNAGNEWDLTAEAVGRGMYSDDGLKSGMVIEDLAVEDVKLVCGEARIEVESLAFMPDQFSQKDINEVEYEAEEKLLQEWMELQEDACDASYETFVSQNLSK